MLREVCIRSGPEWGVFELDGIQTLQGKLLNTASTNMCIEKGLPAGTENTLVFCQEVGGNQPHHGGNNLSQHFGNKYTPTAT